MGEVLLPVDISQVASDCSRLLLGFLPCGPRVRFVDMDRLLLSGADFCSAIQYHHFLTVLLAPHIKLSDRAVYDDVNRANALGLLVVCGW